MSARSQAQLRLDAVIDKSTAVVTNVDFSTLGDYLPQIQGKTDMQSLRERNKAVSALTGNGKVKKKNMHRIALPG